MTTGPSLARTRIATGSKIGFYAASRVRGEICEKAAIDLCETPRRCRPRARVKVHPRHGTADLGACRGEVLPTSWAFKPKVHRQNF